MATVSEEFWKEVLDVRVPLEPVERRRLGAADWSCSEDMESGGKGSDEHANPGVAG